MASRVPLPIELRHAPFRSREVDDFGIPRRRLDAADVLRIFHGVRAGQEPRSTVDLAEALSLVFREGEAISHTTAARLWGIPLPFERESVIHVTVPGDAIRMRRPGVVGHRAQRLPVTMLGILPVTEPAHTWVQLATMLHHDDLVAAADYLVTPRRIARKPALCSVEALAAAIPTRARGAARARRALADVRVGAESRMETLLRLLLVRSGLPEPDLNPAIETAAGTFHPDLHYPQWRLAIEYLGEQHRTDPREWGRDIRRREAFEDAGHKVVAVTRHDLAEPEQLLARVCRAIAQRRSS